MVANLSNPPIQLTEQQRQAIATIEEFLSPSNPSNLFLLAGYAGVGKSSIIQLIIQQLAAQGKRVAVTAPTHKAVDVQAQMAAHAGTASQLRLTTIHSLLGLSLVKRSGEQTLEAIGRNDLWVYDVVIIDECSMIGKMLWEFLVKTTTSHALRPCPKIILMGDPAQLNPVNEGRSPSFHVKNRVVLTQVVRQGTDSPLLEFITAARKSATAKKTRLKPFQPFSCHAANRQNGAFFVKPSTALHYSCKTIACHFANQPNSLRLLCWTNAQVDAYNQQIRAFLYGEDAPRFVQGERLIAREPILAPDRKTIIVQTSTEFMVQAVAIDRYNSYAAWRLEITISGLLKQIYVLHESEQDRFEAETQRLLQAAQKNSWHWKAYYQHLEQFAKVRPCFALTVHNSQGSTFEQVAIDARDLQKRLDGTLTSIREFNRLWYVAASRARHRVLVIQRSMLEWQSNQPLG